MQKNLGLVLFLLMTNVALAQQSASYKLAEYAFNAAGHPARCAGSMPHNQSL